jgi:hypothetical protein
MFLNSSYQIYTSRQYWLKFIQFTFNWKKTKMQKFLVCVFSLILPK